LGLWEELGEGVAFAVEVWVREAKLAKAMKEPGCAIVLGEGRGGDADKLKLPLAELRLMEVEPVEGAMDWSESSEAHDSALSGGDRHQKRTSALE
jgi:hypothetical protein